MDGERADGDVPEISALALTHVSRVWGGEPRSLDTVNAGGASKREEM